MGNPLCSQLPSHACFPLLAQGTPFTLKIKHRSDLTSQLGLSPFSRSALSALPPLPTLPNLTLPPKPFLPPCVLFPAPCSCFFCTNCFSLAHFVWRAPKEEWENHSPPDHLRSHIFPSLQATQSELGTKQPEVAPSQQCLRMLWRLEHVRTLLSHR